MVIFVLRPTGFGPLRLDAVHQFDLRSPGHATGQLFTKVAIMICLAVGLQRRLVRVALDHHELPGLAAGGELIQLGALFLLRLRLLLPLSSFYS